MTDFDELSSKDNLDKLFDKLLASGWIDVSMIHDGNRLVKGNYKFHWTPKGKERAQWMKLVAQELDLGSEGMLALMALCEQHTD